MATLHCDIKRILENGNLLDEFFAKHHKSWTMVVKLLSGNMKILGPLLQNEYQTMDSIGDSRLRSLRNIKEFNPNITTMLLKPPAIINSKKIVKYADISLNSERRTIEKINNEAKLQNKRHKVILMLEMGELREGFTKNGLEKQIGDLLDFSNIDIIGLGTNLGCLFGVEPTIEKMHYMKNLKNSIEKDYGVKIPLISGGSSITLPLIESPKMPEEINHFRIGEALFLGTSPLDSKQFQNLNVNNFNVSANILEIGRKYVMPKDPVCDGNIGHIAEVECDENHKAERALIDIGILDVDENSIYPKNSNIHFSGITSDMMVVDLGKNINENGSPKYKVGNLLEFDVNYMGIARMLNSRFINVNIQ